MRGVPLDQQSSEGHPAESYKERWRNIGRIYPRGTPLPVTSANLRLIGFQVTGKSSDDSSALAKHRAHVYQKAYLQILRSAISAAGHREGEGFAFDDGSSSPRLAIFNILIAILDYEEV